MEGGTRLQLNSGRCDKVTTGQWKVWQSYNWTVECVTKLQLGSGMCDKVTTEQWKMWQSYNWAVEGVTKLQLGSGRCDKVTTGQWNVWQSYNWAVEDVTKLQLGSGRCDKVTTGQWKVWQSYNWSVEGVTKLQLGSGMCDKVTTGQWKVWQSYNWSVECVTKLQLGSGRCDKATQSHNWVAEGVTECCQFRMSSYHVEYHLYLDNNCYMLTPSYCGVPALRVVFGLQHCNALSTTPYNWWLLSVPVLLYVRHAPSHRGKARFTAFYIYNVIIRQSPWTGTWTIIKFLGLVDKWNHPKVHTEMANPE